jgi:hypothetical protein
MKSSIVYWLKTLLGIFSLPEENIPVLVSFAGAFALLLKKLRAEIKKGSREGII